MCIAAIALPHCTGFCHYCSNLLINLEKLFNVFQHLAWRKVKKRPIVIVYEKIWMKLYLNDAKLWNFIAFLIEHPMRRLPLYFVKSWKNSVLRHSIIQSSYTRTTKLDGPHSECICQIWIIETRPNSWDPNYTRGWIFWTIIFYHEKI